MNKLEVNSLPCSCERAFLEGKVSRWLAQEDTKLFVREIRWWSERLKENPNGERPRVLLRGSSSRGVAVSVPGTSDSSCRPSAMV